MKEYVWPMERLELEDYYDMMQNCAKCKYCQTIFPLSVTKDERFVRQCPSGEHWRFDSYYASGRLELARGILEGSLEWTDTAREILYSCTMCGACEHGCRTTQRLTPYKIIRKTKERYIQDGNPLLPAHQKMVADMKQTGNPFGAKAAIRFNWLSSELQSAGNPDVLYFAGCSTCYKQPDLGMNVINILKELDVNYTTLAENEGCCGAPYFHLGMMDDGRSMLEKNIKAIEATGVKTVIFSDALCYATFLKWEVFDLAEPEFEMQHISEFLLPLLKENKSKLKPVEATAAYHDSGFLSLHARIHQEPRECLELIPLLELKEFFRNRFNSFSAGGEPVSKAAFPEMSKTAANVRLTEAEAIGVDAVICADPHDFDNLDEHANENLQIRDFAQIILESLKGAK